MYFTHPAQTLRLVFPRLMPIASSAQRTAKQVPFYIVQIMRAKGKAEGEPAVFVRIIPGII
jgi:hypothetical protein